MSDVKIKIFNLIMLGDHKMGKKSIGESYIYKELNYNILETKGINKYKKEFKYKFDKKFNCVILDSSGEERFHSISKSCIRINDGIILVYSIDDRKSFENIENTWTKIIEDYVDIKIKQLIWVGNKIDINDSNGENVDNNIFSKKEGEEMVKRMNIPFFY